MLKFVIIFVCGFILYKMFMGDKNQKTKMKKKETEHLKATGELVKDPMCGTFVPVDSDIRVKDGETVHRFCSFECRDKYLKQIESRKNISDS